MRWQIQLRLAFFTNCIRQFIVFGAAQVLGWKAKLDVNDMCRDQWAWASKHPKGFEGDAH